MLIQEIEFAVIATFCNGNFMDTKVVSSTILAANNITMRLIEETNKQFRSSKSAS